MKKYLLEAAQLARGFMPHEEGMSLYEIALQVAPRSAILEVGSYCGKSTIYLGAAARQTGSTVFTIDHHRGSEEMQRGWAHHDSELVNRDSGLMDSLPELRRNLQKTSLNDVVVPIIGDSLVVARHWAGDISMHFIAGGPGPGAAEPNSCEGPSTPSCACNSLHVFRCNNFPEKCRVYFGFLFWR